MQVIATRPGTDPPRLARMHTLLAAAAAGVAVEAWRVKAEVDELTGLRNRSGWEKDAQLAIETGRPLFIANVDLDGLKAVNDGPGKHAAGDKLLRDFARSFEVAVVGVGGTVYRHGGDEFSALLPQSSGDLDQILGYSLALRVCLPSVTG